MQNDDAFANWLRSGLRARRMTQRMLGERSGVSHSAISRILAGRRSPTLRTAERLREALDGPGSGSTAPAEVEMALARDDALEPDHVGRIMRLYLALRRRRPA